MKDLFFVSLLGFGLLVTSSCSDDTVNPDEPTVSPSVKGERIPYMSANDTVIWHVQASSGGQILGAGFDPNAAYLSEDCVKAPILDIDKIRATAETRVRVLYGTSGEQISLASADAYGILSELADKTQVLGENETMPLCMGTFFDEEAFKKDVDHSSMFSFAYNSADFAFYNLRVTVMLSDVRLHPEKYLSREFLTDLEQFSAEDLIAKYGTHLLTGVKTGMSVRSLSRTAVLYKDGEEATDWKREVADYYGILVRTKFGVPSLIGTTHVSLYDGNYCGGTTSVTFAGGDVSLLTSEHPTTEEIDAWMKKKCSVDNAALLKILDTPVPLYKLVSDEAKAEALRKATKQHLAKNKLKTLETKLLVQTWADGFYRYATTYDNDRDGGVCGIFAAKQNGMVPLYAYNTNDCCTLSTIATDDNCQLLGYIYESQQPGTVPLYIATVNGGLQTYCTLKDSTRYGSQSLWQQTGIIGYVIPPA